MRSVRLSLAALSFALAAPLAAAAAAAAAARPTLPFIEDDYPKAMAEAKSKKLPVFVEAWAPW
ncbi:MAG TPA: hypothetical protein VGS00_04295 [Thermoanaerobaculia bacterium]|nr:hypothetical protein [Thermoanaerobaculia bacterium]